MAGQVVRPQYYYVVIADTPPNDTHSPPFKFTSPPIPTQDDDASCPRPNTSSTLIHSSNPTTTDANFFWLSEFTPLELVSSFFKPLSAKASLSSFFQKDRSSSASSSQPSLRKTARAQSPACSPCRTPTPSFMAQEDTNTPPNATRDSLQDQTEQDDRISSTDPSSRVSYLSETQEPLPPYPSVSTVSDADVEKQPISDLPDTWKPGKPEWLVMITMAVSSLTVALDSTILVPVLPTLALDLNGTATEAFWAGTSYLLASAVVQPFIAALSDIFGRREATMVSLGVFGVASIICAVSHNFATLLAGRVLQGIGGGGIISQAQIVYADIVPLRQRPRYFALVLVAWAIGTMFGPLVGGAFVQGAHNWRWCFYINLPICGIAITMCFFFLNLSTQYRTLMEKLGIVDWPGAFLFISSLTSFLVAISWGGISYAWSNWRTLVPLLLGGIGILTTIIYEARFAPNPFLNKALFRNVSSIVTYLCALFQGLVLLMTLYYVSFYFAAAKLEKPIRVGISLFPASFLVLPGSIVCSQLITRFGVYRPFVWAGWAITAVGAGMMIHWSVTTSTAYWASSLCILGVGLGVTLSCLNFAVQAPTEPCNAGAAAAMYAFMRSLGMSLGVALGGTIFQNLMKDSLQSNGLSEDIARNAEAWVETTLRYLPDNADDILRTHALEAYIHGFRGVWIAMTAISGFALVFSFLIKHYSLDKILESKFVVEKSKVQV